jgi:hypothetical protein
MPSYYSILTLLLSTTATVAITQAAIVNVIREHYFMDGPGRESCDASSSNETISGDAVGETCQGYPNPTGHPYSIKFDCTKNTLETWFGQYCGADNSSLSSSKALNACDVWGTGNSSTGVKRVCTSADDTNLFVRSVYENGCDKPSTSSYYYVLNECTTYWNDYSNDWVSIMMVRNETDTNQVYTQSYLSANCTKNKSYTWGYIIDKCMDGGSTQSKSPETVRAYTSFIKVVKTESQPKGSSSSTPSMNGNYYLFIFMGMVSSLMGMMMI